MEKKYDWLIAAGLTLNGASFHFKPEWNAYLFLIHNKMFAMLCYNNLHEAIITMKGEPEHNRAMIEMYDCVTEGYYANKIHWISVKLDHDNGLSHDMIVQLLTESYQLIVKKLPKKIQAEIAG